MLDSKSLEETTRYSKVFWERHQELPDWERFESIDHACLKESFGEILTTRTIANITKGEQRLESTTLKDTALVWKIESAPQPWFDLDITQGAWTKEEDNFLV